MIVTKCVIRDRKMVVESPLMSRFKRSHCGHHSSAPSLLGAGVIDEFHGAVVAVDDGAVGVCHGAFEDGLVARSDGRLVGHAHGVSARAAGDAINATHEGPGKGVGPCPARSIT